MKLSLKIPSHVKHATIPHSETQQDIGRQLPTLTNQTCIWCSDGVTPLEFGQDLWRQKSRIPGLQYCVICVILHLAVLTEH